MALQGYGDHPRPQWNSNPHIPGAPGPAMNNISLGETLAAQRLILATMGGLVIIGKWGMRAFL